MAGPTAYPPTLVDAIESLEGITDRGFTFVGYDGGEATVSFDELRHEAAAVHRGLAAAGADRGDRVALVIPDAQQFVPAFLGAARAGAIPVPFYPPTPFGRLPDYVEHLTRMLLVAEPVVLVTSEALSRPMGALIGAIPSLRSVVSIEGLSAHPGAIPEAATVRPEDPVFLQFTSGSTASPKGVVVTHRSLAANAWGILHDALGVGDDDIGLTWLPLYHDMGLIGFVLAPIFQPTRVVFLPTMAFLRQPTVWLDQIHRHRATITFAPNFALGLVAKRGRDLARHGAWDLSCLRVLGCGAEPINPATVREFLDTFQEAGLHPWAVLPSYGMAEATLAMAFRRASQHLLVDSVDDRRYQSHRVAEPAVPGEPTYAVVSCGSAIPGHELAILGSDGTPLGERQVGQIAFRGPSVAAGYFRDPQATERTFGTGWLLTGDLGYRADGQLFVTGREKDLIIIRGRNTDPQQLEWIAEQVAGVRPGNVVAFTRPGLHTEELVLVLEADAEADRDALSASVSRHVVGQAQLPVADVVTLERGTLPKTSSGKVQRQRVRSWYLARPEGQTRAG